MSRRVHVLISGQVQGVGYRYSTYREARARQLTGWVRNLPDGRVEAVFVGGEAALQGMVEWCREGPRGASVSHVACTWSEGAEDEASFVIRS
ncbi:MAG: acylphosphatase [Candidatus Hydrogenedentes bacterium]|nr:acylphosphatase [Candidatus Hydrogenedentota bacterium]